MNDLKVETAAKPPKILVVDDTPANVKLLADRLSVKGYEIATASNGEEALEQVRTWHPDLILLDVVMPGLNGYDVCRRVREDPAMAMLPIIMVTALDPEEERIKGLEAGADDFLTKPVNQAELEARVRSLLRIKSLYDKVQSQADELAKWGGELEQRVQQQVDELERLGRLRRFLSPQVAELVVASGESVLDSHRRHIAALFCDLRGFTTFSETAEPEDVIAVLQAFHETMGRLIHEYQGTIDHRAGDGIMVVFNDPMTCEEPAFQAVKMALAMRDKMRGLSAQWGELGYDLGFGVGLTVGYATLGLVGFEGRFDYCANGSIVNLAARLSDEAKDGQILISQRAHAELAQQIEVEALGEISLKGFREPVKVFSALGLKAS